MDCVSVFDPSFSAYGRLVPGCDTAALEQALYARGQPEEGMVLVSRIADPRLRTAARALKAQLLGDAPASTILYSGRNTRPRRLLRAGNGVFLFGAFDFLLLVTTREELSRRRLGQEKLAAFFVPGRVLIELFDTTLHCVPCHTHDRDGMNVLVLLPGGALRQKAVRGKTKVMEEVLPRLKTGLRQGHEPAKVRAVRRKAPPKKPTEFKLVKPAAPEEDDGEETVSEKLRQRVETLRNVSVRSLYGRLRWSARVAGRLDEPPEDLY